MKKGKEANMRAQFWKALRQALYEDLRANRPLVEGWAA